MNTMNHIVTRGPRFKSELMGKSLSLKISSSCMFKDDFPYFVLISKPLILLALLLKLITITVSIIRRS